MRVYVEAGNFWELFIVGKYEAWFNGFVLGKPKSRLHPYMTVLFTPPPVLFTPPPKLTHPAFPLCSHFRTHTGCIMVAGVLVGMQTYGAFDEKAPDFDTGNMWIVHLDNFILYVFTVECYMKIHMEGTAPWRFLTGDEWRWNAFDFVVVVLCYPFAASLTGGNAAVLRLMRLARLMKLLKKIPQLQMIVMGLAGGLSSIVYIVILLLLVFYLYAIVGVMYFSTNDPWHFGTLHVAMVTLFRAATLEDWTEIM